VAGREGGRRIVENAATSVAHSWVEVHDRPDAVVVEDVVVADVATLRRAMELL
jgi:hypothetical protein